MRFLEDPRRRSVALLGGGVLLFFALLGTLQAFNIRILNPISTGETLVFTGLTVVVFLLLMVLLMLLLRNILKLYADQSSSALGARLRTRMVLGATLIALTPAVFMFLFSFLLMNRSIDRWFSRQRRNCARTRRAWCWNWRSMWPTMRGSRRSRLQPQGRLILRARHSRMCWPRIASRCRAGSWWSTTEPADGGELSGAAGASQASLVPWQDQGKSDRCCDSRRRFRRICWPRRSAAM